MFVSTISIVIMGSISRADRIKKKMKPGASRRLRIKMRTLAAKKKAKKLADKITVQKQIMWIMLI